MDFKNANELLALCEEKNLPVSEIMLLVCYLQVRDTLL